MEKTIHQGRNIKRFREMLLIKQEALAMDMGDDWNQKKISQLEQKEVVDNAILEQVAKLLKVPVEAIKNFDEEAAINIISNIFNEGSILNGVNYNPTFNNADKVWEVVEENKKLYEQLLKVEREKIALLERLVGGNK